MKRRRSLTVVLAAAASAGILLAQGASASSSARATLAGSAAPSAALAHPVGPVTGSDQVRFALVLRLRDESSAQALLRAVSTPGSPNFHHFLSPRAWEARFSPTRAQVAQAAKWLRSQGFSVGAVPKDRLDVPATGTATQVERAFNTHLANYRVAGHVVRMASTSLSVPESLGGFVTGAMGVNEDVAVPANSGSSGQGGYPPPPPAFITAPPCSTYFGQKSTTLTPPFTGYPTTAPDEVCGYVPPQLRSAYGVTGATPGKGATIGIVDAFGSGTIANDAAIYSEHHDPQNPFSNADFTEYLNMPFSDESLCGDWSTEQAIDVESSHGLAPYAHIVYAGAKTCLDPDLFAAEQKLVDNNLANVISNSWGDPAGDLLDSQSDRTAFDNLFMMAGTEGISILYASGDWDDNFYLTGVSAPAYPESSPYDTAVGGTTTEIGQNGKISAEYGWVTGRSILCTANIVNQWPGCTSSNVNTWLPAALDGASGGGTSYQYAEPYWQVPVVPSSLADRNAGDTGEANRVIPDISAEADPSTGFMIGLTETFPDGTVQYGETRYGGTSLASPIFAGMIADADSKAGGTMGFLNPAIYGMAKNDKSTIVDILSPGKQGIYRRDYASSYLSGGKGYITSFRELYYLGLETYCDGSGECYSRPQPLREGPGYDSLTGVGAPSTSFINALSAF